MRWLMIGGGAIAVLVAAVFVIGMLLPVEHSVTVRRTLDADADRVWQAITTIEEFTEWRSGLTAVEPLPDKNGLRVWRETTGEGPMTFETIEFDPGQTFATRIADEDLPFGGTWTHRLERVGEQTTLSITEDGEVYSALYRFVSKFIIGHERTLNTYFDDLENRLN